MITSVVKAYMGMRNEFLEMAKKLHHSEVLVSRDEGLSQESSASNSSKGKRSSKRKQTSKNEDNGSPAASSSSSSSPSSSLSSTTSSSSSAVIARHIPAYLFSMSTPAKVKKELEKYGLSSKGDKQLLEKRLKE
jgi:hypothetical protein